MANILDDDGDYLNHVINLGRNLGEQVNQARRDRTIEEIVNLQQNKIADETPRDDIVSCVSNQLI